jgi:hypothetical protein
MASGTADSSGKFLFFGGSYEDTTVFRSDNTMLPITIDGAYNILPKGCKCIHWSPVTLTFHAPIECNGRDSENVDRMMAEAESVIANTLYNKQ